MKTLGLAICFSLAAGCVAAPSESTDSTSIPLEIENVAQQPHAALCNGGRFR